MSTELKRTFNNLLKFGLPLTVKDVITPPVAEMGKMHFSYPYNRLVFCLQGKAEYWTLNNGEYEVLTLNPNEVAVVHKGALFRSINRTFYESCGVLIRDSSADFFTNDMEHRHLHKEMLNVRLSNNDSLEKIITDIVVSTRQQKRKILTLLAIEEICSLLEKPSITSGAYGKFLQIRAYLHKHWQLKINRRKLGDIFSLNENYLNSLFKRFSGSSFSEYLNDLRLNHVRDLLDTDMEINEIAKLCGYYHASYMIRKFKKKYGITPHKYRKEPLFRGSMNPE